MMDFAYDGTRFAVYHKDQAGDIHIEITTWDGTTWTEVADFPLNRSGDFDFPSIWIYNSGNTAEIVVAAVYDSQNTGGIRIWKCGPGAVSSCDSNTEWGDEKAQLSTNAYSDPEIFIVPNAAVAAGRSVHVVYQEGEEGASPSTPTVRLASICDPGATPPLTVTDHGVVPVPAGYSTNDKMWLGFHNFSSRPQVKWDGTEFHVAFLAEQPSSSPVTHDILRFHAEPADYCF